MSSNVSVRAFKCPTCGAPLEPEAGTLTMKCLYCGSTVIIPESLQIPAPSSGPSMGEVFDFGLKCVDLNKIVGNAMQLPQAIDLAKQGRIDEATNIYGQITGMDHDDAVKSIEAMAAGHAVSLTPGQPGMTWRAGASFSQVSTPVVSPGASAGGTVRTTATGSGRSCGLLVGIVVAVLVLIGGLIAAGFFLFSKGNPVAASLPLGFSSKMMSFGSEGIGAGMFQDPRNIGLDGNGNITVADYQDGRVQTFDPAGKFVSTFTIPSKQNKPYVGGMAVGRDGTIYAAHDRKIYVYDPSGKQLKEIGDGNHRYEDVVRGTDRKLYAVANEESIVRFAPDLSIDLEIPATFSKVTGNQELESRLAVDGLGNMYLVGTFNYLVLKYSPGGTYVDQFGGESKDAATFQPGKFVSPTAIAVDGHGRIYVADFGTIQVFDSSGSYVNSIDANQGAVFGMIFDDQNNLYTLTNQSIVTKYKIQAPASN
jgi:sugar lactone lactonase YvrE/DNA-directed RNA polymerase subunit RPC12/RpoP